MVKDGYKFIKKSWNDTKKEFEKSKWVKLNKETKQILWIWLAVLVLVGFAIYMSIYHPRSDMENLSLTILIIAVCVAIDHKDK